MAERQGAACDPVAAGPRREREPGRCSLLFGAKDCEALEARLMRGRGTVGAAPAPSGGDASHWRAAASRADAPCRRPAADRRQFALRPHRRRREARPGFWRRFRLWASQATSRPRLPRRARLRSRKRVGAGYSESRRRIRVRTPSPNSRFLWTLDEEGRFGGSHPVLVAAVGANAPRPRRVGRGFLPPRRIGSRRRTHRACLASGKPSPASPSNGPLAGLDRRRLIALSAAPMFGRHREFLGYRGFGVLGEEIEAVAVPEGRPATVVADERAERRGRPGEDAAGDERHSSLRRESAGASQVRLEAVEAELRAHRGVRTRGLRPREPEAEVSAGKRRGAGRTGARASGRDAPDAPPPEASLEAEEPSPLRRSPEASESDAPASGDRASRISPSAPRRASLSRRRPSAPPRFTSCATGAAVSSKIVPIRPGALDALARESAQSFPAESVELSRSERDAFREIARALVGRAPASREDRSDERAGADNRRGTRDRHAAPISRRIGKAMPRRPAAPTTTRFGATPARFWIVCRSASWSPATGTRSTPTGRCSISSAIAISQSSRRRTGSRRCSAAAIRKR